MTWLWIIGGVAAALVALRWLLGGAARSARVTGQPTPDDAKIDAQAETEKQKVEHASGQDLADQFSDRMLK